MKKTLSLIIAFLAAIAVGAEEPYAKGWEFGVGANVQSLKRVYVTDYNRVDKTSDVLKIDDRSAIFGAQLYAARELNRHFFLDFQGNFDFASDSQANGKKFRTTILPSVGVQWRLGSYMVNKVIDPFVRVGIGYQYRNFSTSDEYDFVNGQSAVDTHSKHLSPISFGIGSNLWITNRWGLGLQADYIVIPQSHVDGQWQGALRVIYRLGGERKM